MSKFYPKHDLINNTYWVITKKLWILYSNLVLKVILSYSSKKVVMGMFIILYTLPPYQLGKKIKVINTGKCTIAYIHSLPLHYITDQVINIHLNSNG